MFGKLFDCAFRGSMAGAGADIFAVWAYVIAHTCYGNVELNPIVVAALIGMPVESVERAIEYFCKPDPNSRNKAHDGCRLVHEDAYRYLVPSQPIYREMRNEEERRDYLRAKKREARAKKNGDDPSTTVNSGQQMSTLVNIGQQMSTNVNHGQPPSTQSEAEAETEAETYIPGGKVHPLRSAAGGKAKSDPDEIIYLAYPRKEAYRTALAAIKAALVRMQSGEGGLPALRDLRDARKYLHERVTQYARSPAGTRPDKKMIPLPATWFNASRYLDDDSNWQLTTTGENPNGRAESKQAANQTAFEQALAQIRGVDRAGTPKNNNPTW